jgi:hypothetical protein
MLDDNQSLYDNQGLKDDRFPIKKLELSIDELLVKEVACTP